MSYNTLILKIKEKQPDFSYKIKARTEYFTDLLFSCLFNKDVPLETTLVELEQLFTELVALVCKERLLKCKDIWNQYIHLFPDLLDQLHQDAQTIENHDPASKSLEEIYLCYPGFYATAVYRLSRPLYLNGMPLIPRLMTEYAHKLTGVDIHPGADIGCCFFIDHATGVVIGETTVIKNNVKLYQGVTLGALSVNKTDRNIKRHPTVEDNVTIYANATVLGGDTVIGANSIIGGNVWITQSVPPNSLVYHTPEIKIKPVPKK